MKAFVSPFVSIHVKIGQSKISVSRFDAGKKSKRKLYSRPLTGESWNGEAVYAALRYCDETAIRWGSLIGTKIKPGEYVFTRNLSAYGG